MLCCSPHDKQHQRVVLLIIVVMIIVVGSVGSFVLVGPVARTARTARTSSVQPRALPAVDVVDVVMAFAMNYPPPMFYRFLASLRAYDRDSLVVLFVSPKEKNSPPIQKLATWFNATLVVATYATYHELWAQVLGDPSESSAFFTKTNTAGYRFGYQWAWLASYRSATSLRYVFLTDFRDVVFQDHLFRKIKPAFEMWLKHPRQPSTFYPSHPEWPTRQSNADMDRCAEQVVAGGPQAPLLIAFPEGKRSTLGKCKYNRDWLGNVYGFGLADRWANRHVICAGTVLGNVGGITHWLVRMIEEIETFARTGRYNSNDQGIHNYLIHGDHLLSNVTVFLQNNEFGDLVTTMAQVTFSRENIVGWIEPELNPDHRAAVIHQGDRLPEYWKGVERKYEMYLSTPRRHYRPP